MIVAIVVFAVVARLAIYLLPHNRVRHAVVIIDDIVLIGLVVWFGWELFVYLWNRRERLGEVHSAAIAGFAAARMYLARGSVEPGSPPLSGTGVPAGHDARFSRW